MNLKYMISYSPYVLLIAANFIYIYANGFKPIGSYPKLMAYNIIFFILVAIVIMIKVNLLLHSWFIKEEGEIKQKTKILIKKINQLRLFVISVFRKGNQKMMIKIFTWLNLSIFVNKYIPGFLLGLLLATYFQYKGFIEEKFKQQFKKLGEITDNLMNLVLQKLPRYPIQSLKNE